MMGMNSMAFYDHARGIMGGRRLFLSRDLGKETMENGGEGWPYIAMRVDDGLRNVYVRSYRVSSFVWFCSQMVFSSL